MATDTECIPLQPMHTDISANAPFVRGVFATPGAFVLTLRLHVSIRVRRVEKEES